ncbi:tyrosine-type recombinase/integrase [Sphingobacterium thalpophilum]|uniref:tyrosine-type recombinase/integrase n=1 Tax=Sphingobacterium thalpophilum TaxID=259 RepID=UPI003D969C32
MPTYKLIRSYDADGDMSKEWFVSYHYLIPEKLREPDGKLYKRFKVFNTINSIHNKAERKRQLNIVKASIEELLEAGFNPFEQFNYAANSNSSKYNICVCIDEYLGVAKSSLKPNTYSVYEDRLNAFKTYLIDSGYGCKSIDMISKQNITDFLTTYKLNRCWSNKTYNHYLQAITTMFNYFLNNKDNYIETNVAEKIKKLEVYKKGNTPFRNKIFTDILEVMKAECPDLYQFSRFIYYSCMRPDAELRFLQIEHIDMDRRLIKVPHSNSKKKKTQYIPVDDEFYSILLEMNLDKYNDSDYVFGKNGCPGPEFVYEGYFRKKFIPLKKKLGINNGETLYSFKHTRCIHLVEDGEKLHNIIKLTRHKSLVELMDYLKDMGIILGDEIRLKSRSI